MKLINSSQYRTQQDFQQAADAAQLSREALQAIYDAIPGAKPVKRLRNRLYAVERIWEAAPDVKETPKAEATAKVPADSKRDMVLRMLSGTGTTLEHLIVATGWQAHSCRGMLSTLRHKGDVNIVSTREGKTTRYRIAEESATAQA